MDKSNVRASPCYTGITWTVCRASLPVHLHCVVKSTHKLDRKWLRAQSVKGTVRQGACELIDTELIGK